MNNRPPATPEDLRNFITFITRSNLSLVPLFANARLPTNTIKMARAIEGFERRIFRLSRNEEQIEQRIQVLVGMLRLIYPPQPSQAAQAAQAAAQQRPGGRAASRPSDPDVRALTVSDSAGISKNRSMMRRHRASQASFTPPILPPPVPRVLSHDDMVVANRIAREGFNLQNVPLEEREYPYPNAGFQLTPSLLRRHPLAPPARPVPPGLVANYTAPRPIDHAVCICQDEITPTQANDPGVAFCSECGTSQHLSCYNGQTVNERSSRCPFCRATNTTYAYNFPPPSAYSHDGMGASGAAVADVAAAPPGDSAQVIREVDDAYEEGLRIDTIGDILRDLGLLEQTLDHDRVEQVLTQYRLRRQEDRGITQEEFNAALALAQQKKRGGKKIIHKKHSYSYKQSKTNKRRRSKSNKRRRSKSNKRRRSKSNKRSKSMKKQ
jgi:hypothetical protein